MATVFLNGQFLDKDAAKVSAFDAGFQHAVGLFETMSSRVEDGRAEVFRLESHLNRLIASAAELGLSTSLRKHALAEAVAQTAERAWLDEGIRRGRVRLTITGGDLNLLQRDPAARQAGHDPTVLIVVQPATAYPPEMFERGVGAVVADARTSPLNPFEGHKTLNYWWRLRELQKAAAKGAGESLVFQITNHLAGGCVSNAFIVKGGELVTPIARGEEQEVGGAQPGRVTLPSPVLPGVTREFVLEAAAERGLRTARRMIAIEDVLGADELFLTNSSWGVLPVVAVEREAIGGGEVGEVTRSLRRAWAENIGHPGGERAG